MKRISMTILILGLILISCKEKQEKLNEAPILKIKELLSPKSKIKLSEIFRNYHLIPLETNDSCLIGGRGNKIVKHNSSIYILSQNTILHFNQEGHYINKLSSIGNGPNEYPSIFDFDVLTINDEDEIWISTSGGIKIYDVETTLFKRKISIDGHVNQFKYVNESTILAVTPEDFIFKVCNMDGTIRSQFIKKDIANSGQKFNQFFAINNLIVYQLDDTQQGVVYNEKTDSMYYQDILEATKTILTPQINRDYYERDGYTEQSKNVRDNYSCLSTVRTIGDNVILTIFSPNEKKEMIVGKRGEYTIYPYGENSIIENDIVPTEDLRFLSTIICSNGDDSFLFMIPTISIDKKENVNEDDNPWLLEVTL